MHSPMSPNWGDSLSLVVLLQGAVVYRNHPQVGGNHHFLLSRGVWRQTCLKPLPGEIFFLEGVKRNSDGIYCWC